MGLTLSNYIKQGFHSRSSGCITSNPSPSGSPCFSLHHLLHLMFVVCLQFRAQLCDAEQACVVCVSSGHDRLHHAWRQSAFTAFEPHLTPYPTFSEASVTFGFMWDPALSCLKHMSTLVRSGFVTSLFRLPDEVKSVVFELTESCTKSTVGSSSDSLVVPVSLQSASTE